MGVELFAIVLASSQIVIYGIVIANAMRKNKKVRKCTAQPNFNLNNLYFPRMKRKMIEQP